MSERGGDIGSGMLPESHPHAGSDPAASECSKLQGVSEEQKQSDDI